MRRSFLRVQLVTCDQKINHSNEKKTHSTKSKKWRDARTSVEIVWTNEKKRQSWSGCRVIFEILKS